MTPFSCLNLRLRLRPPTNSPILMNSFCDKNSSFVSAYFARFISFFSRPFRLIPLFLSFRRPLFSSGFLFLLLLFSSPSCRAPFYFHFSLYEREREEISLGTSVFLSLRVWFGCRRLNFLWENCQCRSFFKLTFGLSNCRSHLRSSCSLGLLSARWLTRHGVVSNPGCIYGQKEIRSRFDPTWWEFEIN